MTLPELDRQAQCRILVIDHFDLYHVFTSLVHVKEFGRVHVPLGRIADFKAGVDIVSVQNLKRYVL